MQWDDDYLLNVMLLLWNKILKSKSKKRHTIRCQKPLKNITVVDYKECFKLLILRLKLAFINSKILTM